MKAFIAIATLVICLAYPFILYWLENRKWK